MFRSFLRKPRRQHQISKPMDAIIAGTSGAEAANQQVGVTIGAAASTASGTGIIAMSPSGGQRSLIIAVVKPLVNSLVKAKLS